VEYTAPNKKTGFSAFMIQDILKRHSPLCMIRATVGWGGQIQKLIVIVPTEDPLAGKQFETEPDV
jgi:hypothetical protein